MLYEDVDGLLRYGIHTGLLETADELYARNEILSLFGEDFYEGGYEADEPKQLEEILKNLLDEACRREIIDDSQTERDLFDAKLMDCLVPKPSQVQKEFWRHYEDSPQAATDFYYKLSGDSDYIRRYRIQKDRKWQVDSDYGKIDITVNLSKPEKDPKAIAAAKNKTDKCYPACLLCMENEGYAGRLDHPGRKNHRIIPLSLNGKAWGFQYSPYVYYNEHCIVLNREHIPMKVSHDTFVQLFDFVKQFPHYFLGSNADLPIVGGSILSHDHYQGGCYTFAMEQADYRYKFRVNGFKGVETGVLHWPLSVIRLESYDEEELIGLADYILGKWRDYTDREAGIFAFTEKESHNTVTPIARMKKGKFQLDLALRNNRTTEEYPLGIFHPHPEYHNIKKENIGLIEVMGLAVLPARLDREMKHLENLLSTGQDYHNDELVKKHADWVDSFIQSYTELQKEDIEKVLEKEIGKTFVKVLENAGVFPQTKDGIRNFKKFTASL